MWGDEHPGMGSNERESLKLGPELCVMGKPERGPWGWNTVTKQENEEMNYRVGRARSLRST